MSRIRARLDKVWADAFGNDPESDRDADFARAQERTLDEIADILEDLEERIEALEERRT
jgi:hypothetical protein